MYIKYYSLMGSTVVMVLVPVIILITACISMHKAIPAGNQKQRTLRIMTIIILMFTVCHVPKVSKLTNLLLSLSLSLSLFLPLSPLLLFFFLSLFLT